jgi:hypothetical protein
MNGTDIARFNERVQPIPEVGCWIWVGACSDGYGVFKVDGRQHRAHRLAWAMAGNELPEYPAMVLDHICRERSCVNPDHLRAVTNKQNILENSAGLAAANAKKTHCKNGHPYTVVRRGARFCTECPRFPYHEKPEYRLASRERIRAVRAERTAAGLTTRGTPRKYKGYDKTQSLSSLSA